MNLNSGEVFFFGQSNGFVIPETISLFGLSISFYGLFLVLAALVGIIVVREIARRKKLDTEKCLTLLTVVIVSALIGARIHYVLFHWQAFVRRPAMIFQMRSGGLSYFGALFVSWFAVKWIFRRTKEEFLKYADTLSRGAACAAPLVWAGCAFVREPLGRFYDGFFSVSIGAEYLSGEIAQNYSEELMRNTWNTGGNLSYIQMHPVAVYGIVFSVFIFIALCFYSAKAKGDGSVFTAYLVMNAVQMLFLEMFRADRACIWGTDIPVNYVISGVILITVLYGKVRYTLKKRKDRKRLFLTQ